MYMGYKRDIIGFFTYDYKITLVSND